MRMPPGKNFYRRSGKVEKVLEVPFNDPDITRYCLDAELRCELDEPRNCRVDQIRK
jgi:hypothetical protein